MDLRENQFSAAELILEAAKKKLRIEEVPVSVLRRAEVESMKPNWLRYSLGFLLVIIQTWLRRQIRRTSTRGSHRQAAPN